MRVQSTLALSLLFLLGLGCTSSSQRTSRSPARAPAPATIDDDDEDPTTVDEDLEAEDDTVLSPDLSGGQGGPLGQIEQRFAASNGRSSTYKTIIPSDIGPDKAYGLSIHLHGDGGGDYSWLFKPNVEIAARHDLIGIVVMAPNIQRRWYEGGEENAEFLHELIQKELFKKYNIDKRRVYFSGVSGGSQFLTGQFIPLYGQHYNSGAVLLCGGPANWLERIDTSETFVKSFKLYWYTHTGDFLVDQVEEGISYYKEHGFSVDSEIVSGGSHCDFDEGIDGALEKKLPLVLH